ncbi:hypothetical protein A3J43_00600 [Candidatus Uhrbacteria bacterium RIFCSPHIGHO2_12_FULL_54_23]|uniref:Uncharacterized protein n=1 Tax=Candidatus Uhrbacteria bacterium RIFCSPHIGHO2_12_FULL_54_23 TaxID=1802397 RepID=A0A1F7UL69_9BACT|nr:MAG: hypothetical protein A3J43_00600 [Candidatus Uhrbacteria bacterium RIFCSPHIGHO2_12_FULL_54_23]
MVSYTYTYYIANLRMKLAIPVTHISVQGDTVTLELPKRFLEDVIHAQRNSSQTTWDALERLYGAWKGKSIDGLIYERRLREEWDGRP